MANSETSLTTSWQDVTGDFAGLTFNVTAKGGNIRLYIADDGEAAPTTQKGTPLYNGSADVVQISAIQKLYAKAYKGTALLIMNG